MKFETRETSTITIDLTAPVVGKSLIGRDEWVELFIDNFVNKPKRTGAGQYALVAPRRTGKTSIITGNLQPLV